MKPTDHDPNPMGPKATGEVQRTGELIRLHTDETDQSLIAIASESTDDSSDGNRRRGFVIRTNLDFNVAAKNTPSA
jgi:hypothetical protein